MQIVPKKSGKSCKNAFIYFKKGIQIYYAKLALQKLSQNLAEKIILIKSIYNEKMRKLRKFKEKLKYNHRRSALRVFKNEFFSIRYN